MSRFAKLTSTFLVFAFSCQFLVGQLFQSKSSRSQATCDSIDMPCDAQNYSRGRTIAVPTTAAQHRCDCPTCKRKDNHIHIHLTAEQVQELVQAQSVEQTVPSVATTQEAGHFIAPPATGAIVEESTTVGWRGPVLRFPEFKIGLPSIELPSRFRVRHPRRMNVDSSQAAYVTQRQTFQQVPQQQLVQMPVQPSVTQPNNYSNIQAKVQQIEQMTRQLAEKERLLEQKLKQCNTFLRNAQPQSSNGCDSSGCDLGQVDPTIDRPIYSQPQRQAVSKIRVDPNLANDVSFIPQIKMPQNR